MKKLTLTLAVAASLSLAPAAGATRNPHIDWKARAIREARQLRRAAATIRSTRAELAASRSALASATENLAAQATTIASDVAMIQARNNQIGSLNATVAKLTAERDSYLGEAEHLQTLLNVEPDSLAYAESQVRYEVSWAQSGGSTMPVGELVALSAMDYVVGHVSTGAFGYRETHGLPLPTSDAQSVLAYQAGICGHAALTFAALVKGLGYPVRSVQFYYSTPTGTPDSHIAAEVSYGGSWHFFDPTFGNFWQTSSGDAASIADARAGVGLERRDTISFTNLIEDPWYNGDDTAFEVDPATDVQIDKQPFVG